MNIYEYPLIISLCSGDMNAEKEYELTVSYTVFGGCRGEYLDGLQITPDEEPEIEIESIKPASNNPTTMELLVAKWASEQDTDQLTDHIWSVHGEI